MLVLSQSGTKTWTNTLNATKSKSEENSFHLSVGHCHPKVNEALHNQINKLWHTTNIYAYPGHVDYAKKLTDKFPGDLKVCLLVNSGSEANDFAIHLARLYTGRYDLLTLRNSYHGMSGATMGLTNLNTWKYTVPQGFGVHQAMNAGNYKTKTILLIIL